MALFLGSNAVKLMLKGTAHKINLTNNAITQSGDKLFSLDGYILKDSNGMNLIVEPDGEKVLSSEGYALKDSKDLYLIAKEEV